jgi:hypothetical protein
MLSSARSISSRQRAARRGRSAARQAVGEGAVEDQPALGEERCGIGIEAVPLPRAQQQQAAGIEAALRLLGAPRAGPGVEQE